MNLKCLAIVACAVIASATCNAQEMLTGTISLRDALAATISTNPKLRSFPLRNDALLGEREIADLKPPFMVGAEIEDALGTGDIRDFTGAEATLRLSSVVEMGGKRAARVGMINRRIDVLNAEQRVVELDLLVEVVRRFIDVAVAQEQVGLQAQSTAIAEQTVDSIEPLVTAGQAPQLETDRAQAALLRARLAEQAANARLGSARIRLASMWANNTPQFGAVSSDILTVEQAESIESILAELASNPDIEIFAAESRLLEAELRLAQTRQEGDIQWSAGIRHLKEFDDTGFAFGVTIPLFNKARASGAERSARANLQEVELRQLTALIAIEGEIRSLHQALQQAINQVNTLQQQVIPILQDVQQQTLQAYGAGNYSYVELITAQQEFLDAQLSLISSAGNVHRIRAEIERLSGLPLTGQ
ncbi:MAG: TolC family protein [Porticoccaceae bacterium]|nr:TolC family protein [Porticoccaceae bacterium]